MQYFAGSRKKVLMHYADMFTGPDSFTNIFIETLKIVLYVIIVWVSGAGVIRNFYARGVTACRCTNSPSTENLRVCR